MNDDRLPDRPIPQDDRDLAADLEAHETNLRARRIVRDGLTFDSETDYLSRSLLAAMVRELQGLLREVTVERDAALAELTTLNEHWANASEANGRLIDLADRALNECQRYQDENAALRSQVDTLNAELQTIRATADRITQRPVAALLTLLGHTLFGGRKP